MESFEKWLSSNEAQQSCIAQWSEQLIKLGASWDTFQRDSNEVVDDLIKAGIPFLAARDIVKLVADAIRWTRQPMAVFWDLESMPIPSSVSGREVVTRIKSVLSTHGELGPVSCVR